MKKLMTFLFVFVFAFVFLTPVKAFDLNLGNPVEDRDYVDSYHNFSIIDTNLSAGYQGIVTEIQYWARNNNPFKFLIVDGTRKVMWISDLITPQSIGMQAYTPSTFPVVQPGWNIGMYFTLTGTIPFDYDNGADPAFYEANNAGEPVLGEILTKAGETKRYYSVYASGWQFKGDTDGDGVNDINDLCPDNTNEDGDWSSEKGWGTNRWQVQKYDGKLVWYQNKPSKKENGNTPTPSSNGIEYTYGCNGHQILDLLTKELGDNAMSGHYKFGLSSSVLGEFHENFADGNISGKYFIETIVVPANKSTPTTSVYPLVNNVNYLLMTSGTFTYNSAGDWADAEWYSKNGEIVKGDTEGSKPYVLDVSINGYSENVNWGNYNITHNYQKSFIGTGDTVNFSIYDSNSSDNKGSIIIDIYAQI